VIARPATAPGAGVGLVAGEQTGVVELSVFRLQWTGAADLKTEHMNQAAIADEGHDPDPQVDDLLLGELRAQFVEEFVVGALVIAGEYFGIADGGFFTRVQQGALAVARDLGDLFFRQAFLPRDREAGVASEMAVVFLRHHEAGELGDNAVDLTAGLQLEFEVVVDEFSEDLGGVGKDLNEAGAAEFLVVGVHDVLEVFGHLLKGDGTDAGHERFLRV
jgi:hypothetical protein